MEKWIYAEEKTLFYVFVSTIVVFISIILLTRIFGKRSFSKMSSFDFAMTVAIGSVMASVIISKSVSLQYGISALAIIYGIQMLVAAARRTTFIQKIVDNQPTLLMKDGKLLENNLKTCKVTESDIKAKLREANVIQLSEVKAVVFESTGDISVLHGTSDKTIDEWIMDF